MLLSVLAYSLLLPLMLLFTVAAHDHELKSNGKNSRSSSTNMSCELTSSSTSSVSYSYNMQFRSRSELEAMDPINLPWEQYYVVEAMVGLEKKILELKEKFSLASAQLQEATRRRHTVIFPFEDDQRRENPVLRGLRHNLHDKYEDVKNAENALISLQKYCDLIRDIFG